MYRIIFKQDKCISFLYQQTMHETKCPFCRKKDGLCGHLDHSMNVDYYLPLKQMSSLALLTQINTRLDRMGMM